MGIQQALLAGGRLHAFSITAGSAGGAVGYDSSIGSISNSQIPNGAGANLANIISIYAATSPSTQTIFEVENFSANPGQNWFRFLNSNGATLRASDASFSYNSGTGVATWTWSGNLLSYSNGVSYPSSVRL